MDITVRKFKVTISNRPYHVRCSPFTIPDYRKPMIIKKLNKMVKELVKDCVWCNGCFQCEKCVMKITYSPEIREFIEECRVTMG